MSASRLHTFDSPAAHGVIKKYIAPAIVSLLLVLGYFVIRFKKIGWKKVALKTIITPIVAELLLFSIISITRLPFSRLAVSIGAGLYISIIITLTVIFENERNKYYRELESN